MDKEFLGEQQCHWENVFSNNNSKFGEKSSEPAMKATELFKEKGKTK